MPMPSPAAVRHGQRREVQQDAIDRIFAEYELLYPLHFRKAYDSPEKLGKVKGLWFQILQREPPQLLLDAALLAASRSKFLPTVKEVLECCEELSPPAPLSLPAAPVKPADRKKILRRVGAIRKTLKQHI